MKKLLIVLSFTMGMFVFSPNVFSQIGVGITVTANIAPPALPVYVQPQCPADGYMWTPGYWAYGDGGYYWVPGVWVNPPQPGYLWTPCYWGFVGGSYGWHRGYWGQHIGFYGGVNYGYGYGGSGFGGGRWEGGHFRYNTAVVNVNSTVIHNTYIDRTVIVNNTSVNNRTSYNGGARGIHARPSMREQAAMKESHIAPTSSQAMHEQSAGRDKSQYASANHGHPATAAMNKVGGEKYGQQGHTASASAPNRTQSVASNHTQASNNSQRQQGHIQNTNNTAHQSPPGNQRSGGNNNGGNHSSNFNQHPQQQHAEAQHQAPHEEEVGRGRR